MDDIASFPEVRPQRPRLSYAIKQLVSHEIELQRMRKEGESETAAVKNVKDAARGKESRVGGAPRSAGESSSEQQLKQDSPSVSASPSTPRHLQKLQAKKLNGKEVEDRSPVDFFGRPIKVDASSGSGAAAAGGSKSGGGNDIISSDIWFKFKEGYNNAVRRLVRMKDLQAMY